MLREEISTLLFDNYILSMTHEASHLLEMRFLASFAGLAGRRADSGWYCEILLDSIAGSTH